jgi:hypothetical protein
VFSPLRLPNFPVLRAILLLYCSRDQIVWFLEQERALPEMLNKLPYDPMDHWTRNARLYERLKAEGLFVDPVYDAERPGGIEYLRVSSATPRDRQG